MRLRTQLTLVSSPLLLLHFWFTPSLAAPSNSPASPDHPFPASTTLIDGLSSDPDFTLFLQLVQRAKLVPTFNKLNGSTLFAPTNDAIRKYTDKHPSSVWAQAVDWATFERTPGRGFNVDHDDDDDELEGNHHARMRTFDNVQEELRQHIFYHILNYTIADFPLASDTPVPQAHLTLHFPQNPTQPPSKEPPPSPPWLPTPGGLLGGEPQRLRIATVPSSFASDQDEEGGGDKNKDKEWKRVVGVNDRAQGGSQVIKDSLITGNGNIFAINRVLALPRDLEWQVMHHPLLSTFARYIPPKVKETLLRGEPHLTVFFPVNEAWDALDPIERRYLESGFAESDVERIVGLHASESGVHDDEKRKVGWSEYWNKKELTDFTTIQGHTLHVNSSQESVSGRTILEKDIYASNGVLHVVSELLLNPDIFKLNAEKYLLALNATSFVSLLRAANMSHYVDDKHDGKAWTILAPQDDVFTQDTTTRWQFDSLASSLLSGFVRGDHNDSTSVEKVLKYHLIPGKLTPKDLEDGSLLGTELREPGLGGGRQKLPVVVDAPQSNSKLGQWAGNGHISFGGATVIHDAVEIGDTIIYVISKVLEPPPDAIEAALPSSHLSTFLTSVFASKLDEELKKEPLTTLLVPHNSAWNPLGLLTNYLLLPEARKDLENVVKHHVLKEVVYSGDASLSESMANAGNGGGVSKTYQTMEGSDLRIDSGRVISSGGWSADLNIRVLPGDILTQTGVVHEIKGNGILIPRSVNVNVGDLAKAGKGSIMIGLVQKAGYGGVLNGTLRLDVDEWLDRGWTKDAKSMRKGKKQEVGWTLLCPNDDAFRGLNLTQMLEDREGLTRFVRQHIIPVAPTTLAALLAQEAALRKKKDKSITQDELLLEENPNRPIPFFDDASYPTLLTPSSLRGDVVFKATGSNPDSFLVGIRGATGPKGESESARILNWGRTTTATTPKRKDGPTVDDGTQTPISLTTIVEIDVLESETSLRSGVIVIDQPLYPYVPTWWVAWGQAAATGAVGSLIIVSGFASLVLWWRRKGTEATYEPIGGQEDD